MAADQPASKLWRMTSIAESKSDALPAYGSILIPTDGSRCSDSAVAEGLRLACSIGASVTFMHVLHAIPHGVYETPDGRLFSPRYPLDALPAARLFLDRAVALATSQGVMATSCLLGRDAEQPGDAILRLELEHDMTVMASHGWRGVDRVLLGSIADYVLRRALHPVLVVSCASHED